MADTLEQVIENARAEAAILRRNGYTAHAESLEVFAKDAERAATDYLTWLNESQAVLRSGHSVTWLRSRFARLEREGHAKLVARGRYYRMLAVPQKDRDGGYTGKSPRGIANGE